MARPKKNKTTSNMISLEKKEGRVSLKVKNAVESVTDTPYMLEGLREKIFLDRYSVRDIEGKPTETNASQMWRRVAKALAGAEKESLQKEWEDKFYEAMYDFKFVPAGRILSGAGTGYEVTFYNCYVLPDPKDSRLGIMQSISDTVEIQSRAGGVGVNLSCLRPRGARVKKVNGTSSGPVNWAALYSTANHDVIQQGGSRRGALMLMLHDWHPDVAEFIHVKEDLTRIPGANLSVCLSDSFMEAVKKDQDWDLKFPDLDDPEYDEVWEGDIQDWESRGKKVKIYKTVKAREVWDQICTAAWTSAEPGIHFLERSNKRGNTWYYEKLVCTNPCGEQPLGPWAVCNLGSINLSAFVKDGQIDYKALASTAKTAVRLLDNAIDVNYYFNHENEIKQKETRRVGLGTMGLGDALIKMKIKYGSAESIEEIKRIYSCIRDAAYEASSDLSEEKGPFPKFDKEKYLQGFFIKQLPNHIREEIEQHGIRNAVVLTQAPTGTISLLAGVSSGIEPVYDFIMRRTDRTGTSIIYHPLLDEWKKENPNSDQFPDYFVNANGLTPEEHIKVQAVIQEYTDASISKTVNAPNTHTIEDVKNLYLMAYDMGLKGLTYFRDGSRTGVLEHIDEKEKPKEKEEVIAGLRPRPDVLEGKTYKVRTPIGTAFISINNDDKGNIFEVFINVGRAGTDITADAQALGRLISTALRIPSDYSPTKVALEVADQLRGIGGSSSLGFGSNKIKSLSDAIGKVIQEHLQNTTTQETKEEIETYTKTNKDFCPNCGQVSFVYEEGCQKCYLCGYSKC